MTRPDRPDARSEEALARANARRRHRPVPAMTMACTTIGALLALTGCGLQPGTSTTTPPPSSAGTTVSTSPSPTASSSPSPSPSPTGPSGTAPPTPAEGPCSPATTRLSLTYDNAGAGSVFYRLEVTNTGQAACTLSGYPGVSMESSSGAQIGAPAGRQPSAYSTVTLPPGATSYASLAVAQAANYGTSCTRTTAASLRVYLPGSTDSATTPATQLTGCTQTGIVLMTVKPFGAG